MNDELCFLRCIHLLLIHHVVLSLKYIGNWSTLHDGNAGTDCHITTGKFATVWLFLIRRMVPLETSIWAISLCLRTLSGVRSMAGQHPPLLFRAWHGQWSKCMLHDYRRTSEMTIKRSWWSLMHFWQSKNIIFEWAGFNRQTQQSDECVEQYIVAIYWRIKTCNYGNLTDKTLCGHFVVSICDTVLSEHLQMDPDLTLDKAMKSVRQREVVKEQHQQIQGRSKTSHIVVDEIWHAGRGGTPVAGVTLSWTTHRNLRRAADSYM